MASKKAQELIVTTLTLDEWEYAVVLESLRNMALKDGLGDLPQGADDLLISLGEDN